MLNIKNTTQKQISICTGVPVRTIQEWTKTKPKLFKAIKSYTTLCNSSIIGIEVWIDESDNLTIYMPKTDTTFKLPYQEQYSLVKNVTRDLGSYGVVDWYEKDDRDVFILKPIFKQENKMQLNILIDKDGNAWLRDGEQQLMGYENIDQLIRELDGAIRVDEDTFEVKLINEDKLTEKLLFL